MIEHHDAPSAPMGWETSRAELIQLGGSHSGAVVWVAPAYGGNCIGYAVRLRGSWAPVFHSTGPRELREQPTRFGCPILFPFPGVLPDARYEWEGVTRLLPPNGPAGGSHAHGFAHTHPWRTVDANEKSALLEFSTATDLDGQERDAYPFAVRLRLLIALDGAALVLRLTATNDGDRTAPVGLGLHPYFDPDLFGGDRVAVRADLPGRTAHLMSPFPTGVRVARSSGSVPVPAVGEHCLVGHTDLGDCPVAALVGPHGTARVQLSLDAGFRDLLLFAAAEQPSVALEPLSCTHSAASWPPGHRDGLPGLPPGERLEATARITVEEVP